MRIGRRLRELGHTVTPAREVGLERADDREILLFAARSGLIVVTHNERRFGGLLQAEAIDHAGILVVPQVELEDVPRMAESINRLAGSEHQPLANALYRFTLASGWEQTSPQSQRPPERPAGP